MPFDIPPIDPKRFVPKPTFGQKSDPKKVIQFPGAFRKSSEINPFRPDSFQRLAATSTLEDKRPLPKLLDDGLMRGRFTKAEKMRLVSQWLDCAQSMSLNSTEQQLVQKLSTWQSRGCSDQAFLKTIVPLAYALRPESPWIESIRSKGLGAVTSVALAQVLNEASLKAKVPPIFEGLKQQVQFPAIAPELLYAWGQTEHKPFLMENLLDWPDWPPPEAFGEDDLELTDHFLDGIRHWLTTPQAAESLHWIDAVSEFGGAEQVPLLSQIWVAGHNQEDKRYTLLAATSSGRFQEASEGFRAVLHQREHFDGLDYLINASGNEIEENPIADFDRVATFLKILGAYAHPDHLGWFEILTRQQVGVHPAHTATPSQAMQMANFFGLSLEVQDHLCFDREMAEAHPPLKATQTVMTQYLKTRIDQLLDPKSNLLHHPNPKTEEAAQAEFDTWMQLACQHGDMTVAEHLLQSSVKASGWAERYVLMDTARQILGFTHIELKGEDLKQPEWQAQQAAWQKMARQLWETLVHETQKTETTPEMIEILKGLEANLHRVSPKPLDMRLKAQWGANPSLDSGKS